MKANKILTYVALYSVGVYVVQRFFLPKPILPTLLDPLGYFLGYPAPPVAAVTTQAPAIVLSGSVSPRPPLSP